MTNWTKTFMDLARFYASLSKDPSTKCGAVITKGKRQISQGFNGLPQGVIDSPERLNDRDIKYPMMIHAEVNAILFAAQPLHGCSIYVWPMAPCARCAGLIIQSGIKTVYAPESTPDKLERWGLEMEMANRMYYEAGVVFSNVSLTGELNGAKI